MSCKFEMTAKFNEATPLYIGGDDPENMEKLFEKDAAVDRGKMKTTHAFITFLGNKDYKETSYDLPCGKSSALTKFLGLWLAKEKKVDRFVVLGTSGSCWHSLLNWINDENLVRRSSIDSDLMQKLETAVRARKVTNEQLQEFRDFAEDKMGIKVNFKIIDVSVGEGSWTKFANNLNEATGECERISLDITHSFRHLPIFSLLGAMYLEKVKGVEVESVYYGRFQGSNGTSELYDLKGFLTMNSWLTALSVFDHTGDYSVFWNLLPDQRENLKRALFMERTYQLIPAREEIRNIRENLKSSQGIESMFLNVLKERLERRLEWVEEESTAKNLYDLATIYLHQKDYLLATLFFEESFIAKFCEMGNFMKPIRYFFHNSRLARKIWEIFKFNNKEDIRNMMSDWHISETMDKDEIASVALNDFYQTIKKEEKSLDQQEEKIEPLFRYISKHCDEYWSLRSLRNRMVHRRDKEQNEEENAFRTKLDGLISNLFPDEWKLSNDSDRRITPVDQNRRVLVTFLGRVEKKDDYKQIKYRFQDGEESSLTHIVGPEIAKKTVPDRFVILGTSGSSWHFLPAYLGKSIDSKLEQELKEAAEKKEITNDQLQQLKDSIKDKMDMEVDLKIIPDKLDEDDQIEVVKILEEAIDDCNRIDLDITHSLRPLPALTLLGAMYLGKIKDVKVESIYYGAFPSESEDYGQVYEFTEIIKGNKWLTALSIFKYSGDYSVFLDLLPEQGTNLKQAFFKERTSQIHSAKEIIRQVLQSFKDHPLSGVESLFQKSLEEQLDWIEEGDKSEDKLISIYLSKRKDYIRAALLIETALQRLGKDNEDYKGASKLRDILVHGLNFHHGADYDDYYEDDYCEAEEIISNEDALKREFTRMARLILPAWYASPGQRD